MFLTLADLDHLLFTLLETPEVILDEEGGIKFAHSDIIIP